MAYSPIKGRLKNLTRDVIKTYTDGDSFNVGGLNFVYNIKLVWGDHGNYVAQENSEEIGVSKMGNAGAEEVNYDSRTQTVKFLFTISFDNSILDIADVFFEHNFSGEPTGSLAIMPYVLKRNAYFKNVGYGSSAYTEGELALAYFTVPAYSAFSVVFHELAHYANCHALQVPGKYMGRMLDYLIYTNITNNKYTAQSISEKVKVQSGIQKFRYLKGAHLFSMYGRNNFVRAFAEHEAESTAYFMSLALTMLFLRAYEMIIASTRENEKTGIFKNTTILGIQTAVQEVLDQNKGQKDKNEIYRQIMNQLTSGKYDDVPIRQRILDDISNAYREQIVNLFEREFPNILKNMIEPLKYEERWKIGIGRLFNIVIGKDTYTPSGKEEIVNSRDIAKEFYEVMADMFLREFVFFFYLNLAESVGAVKTPNASSITANINVGQNNFSEHIMEFLRSRLALKTNEQQQPSMSQESIEKWLLRYMSMGSLTGFIQAAYAALENHSNYIKNWVAGAKGSLFEIIESYKKIIKYARALRLKERENAGEQNAVRISEEDIEKVISIAKRYKSIIDEAKDIKSKKMQLENKIKEMHSKELSKEEKDALKERAEELAKIIKEYNSKVASFVNYKIQKYEKMLGSGVIMQVLAFAIYDVLKEENIEYLPDDNEYIKILEKISDLNPDMASKKIEKIQKRYISYCSKDSRRVNKVIEDYLKVSGIYLPDFVDLYNKKYDHIIEVAKELKNEIQSGTISTDNKINTLKSVLLLTGIGIPNSKIYDNILSTFNDSELKEKVSGLADELRRDDAPAAFVAPFLIQKAINSAYLGYKTINEFILNKIWHGIMIEKLEITDLMNVNRLSDNAYKGRIKNYFSLNSLYVEFFTKLKEINKSILSAFYGINQEGENAKASAWDTSVFHLITPMNISDSNYTTLQLTVQLNIAEVAERALVSAGAIEFLTGILVPEEIARSIKEEIIAIFAQLALMTLMSQPRSASLDLSELLANLIDIFTNPPDIELPIDVFIIQASEKLKLAGNYIASFVQNESKGAISEPGKQDVLYTFQHLQTTLSRLEEAIKNYFEAYSS